MVEHLLWVNVQTQNSSELTKYVNHEYQQVCEFSNIFFNKWRRLPPLATPLPFSPEV